MRPDSPYWRQGGTHIVTIWTFFQSNIYALCNARAPIIVRKNHIHDTKTPVPGDEIDEVAPKEESVGNLRTYTKSITNEANEFLPQDFQYQVQTSGVQIGFVYKEQSPALQGEITMTTQIFTQENTTTRELIKTAINLASAYHEVQLKKYMDMLDGCNPPELANLIDKYHCIQELNTTSEEAFVAFLQYLGQ